MTLASDTPAPVARTEQGSVRGFQRHGLLSFRGVPYAKPPLGPLRFRAPEPAEPWDGVRDATEYGPASLQAPMASNIPLPSAPGRRMSEDCLYLNITTPGLQGSRPVMVWIHGGGFTTGAGADFAGRQIAARGVVVVAINYRLGALGFLALPRLADEQGRYTNFGLRDQIAALRWVRTNIAGFGGDPGNVTIFGESAGGMSVGCLLASPGAQGLFHKAIAQSGAGHHANTADLAREYSKRFCEHLGVSPGDAVALRGADADAILKASDAMEVETAANSINAGRAWAGAHLPVVDGSCLLDLPIRSFRRGEGSVVPVMAGSNAGECKLFESAWESGRLTAADFDRRFGELGPDGDRIRRIYFDARTARGDSTKPLDVWSAALTDLMYRVPADRLLEANAAAGRPTFGYLFSWQSPAMGGALGACHGLDTFLMTGTHTLVPDFAGSGPSADALAAAMMDAWVAFARRGDPSTPVLTWPPFDVATRTLMELSETCRPVHGWHEEERRAWDGVIP